jgi:hypothetical protein
VGRWLGVLAVVLGALVLGFDVSRWDGTVLTLSSGHGVHASDVLGVALVAAGTIALWSAAGRASRPPKH